ncbi:hypothetical protein GB928_027745 [Shinella curvata]|uniref:Nucleotidyltransferase AbiEii toxin of type IV toxin-antitoxin system n=1 Tax=Shinella curvata TaxID=1817964 RepID=A0ABT8XMM2_9HYPH|nr:hypothetical protein [Shinella curvata]MCJ8057171.1 hypothetical protein [Shinella curvata]MDO6124982.1 hypothetical protein [Shinella curvata]
MALLNIQRQALLAISENRNPANHIGGGTAINAGASRLSNDIDIFHDLVGHEDRVKILAESVDVDVGLLERAGFELHWDARKPEFYRAVIRKENESTVLEWVVDSAFRFFPAVQDETFGYKLDMFDLATNKALCAASRREPRDIVDLLYIDAHHVPLAAVIWAAPAKDAGYTPESLIADIRRGGTYRQDDYDRLLGMEGLDAGDISRSLRAALERAESFVASVPRGYDGVAFLENGRPVLPDVTRLDVYETLEAELQAPWPTSSEIASEMISPAPRRM